jgi:2-phospho-L-lactate guanylyltransferase
VPRVKRPAWAIVPAKSLTRGKSRLRPALGDDDRARFARGVLEHVLDTLALCELDGVLVATDGDDVSAVASARGAQVLRDGGSGSLAGVIDRALENVASRGARSALVLMADLPRIGPDDVRAVLAALGDHDVALVRDHAGYHTNALAVSPPTILATRFGKDDSFVAHLAAIEAARLSCVVVANERIAFDVDLPSDHEELAETGSRNLKRSSRVSRS